MIFETIAVPPDSIKQPVQQADIERICSHAFGTIRAASVQEIGNGAFNNTYLIGLTDGSKQVLRIAPHNYPRNPKVLTNEAFLMRKEYHIQPHLTALAVVPAVLQVDFSGNLIDRDYMLQSYIEGDGWADKEDKLPAKDNEAIWFQLGAYAELIHQQRGTSFGFPYPEQTFATWSEAVHYMLAGIRLDLERFRKDTAAMDQLIMFAAEFTAVLDEITVPKLVHGDLWSRNIIIDRSLPRINGIIDFERVFWGDPMAEWIFHLNEVPASFWQGYGQPMAVEGNAAVRNLIYKSLFLFTEILYHARYDSEGLPEWYEQIGQINQQLASCLNNSKL